MKDEKDTGTLTSADAADVGVSASGAPEERRYVLGEEHARGGIGRILRATDTRLGRTVAIKELLTPSARAEARFLREARITARLEHPAIVPVHDAGRWPEDGRPFYSMKLVSGRDLKQAVTDSGSFEARMALLPNVRAVAEAIAYAHSRGVIHRDLKPANVIIGAYGETMVTDWGLAKELGEPDLSDDEAAPYRRAGANDHDLTVDGAVIGTPAFMPPEQALGAAVDARADVYALGAMLYQVVTGRPPYDGRSAEVLAKVRAEAPQPVRAVEPRVPQDLAAIIDKAMAREPTARYEDAGGLARDLVRYLAGQLVGAHHYSWAELIWRWARRNRGLALATATFVLAAAVGGAWFLRREQGLRVAAEDARDRADQQTRALLEEQGRSELAAGRPHRAAVYLAAALERDPDSTALRWLLSEAMTPMAARGRTLAGHTRDVLAAAYAGDGRWLVTGSTDGTARIWDMTTGQAVRTLAADAGSIDDVDFSQDGSRVVTGGGKHGVRVWDARTGAAVAKFEVNGFRVAISPDGARIVAGTQRDGVAMLDVASGAVAWRSERHRSDRVGEVAWDPSGERVVTAGWDGRAFVWDAATGQELLELPARTHFIGSVAFDARGERIALLDVDVTLTIHDARTGALLATHLLPAGTTWGTVRFFPDGRTLSVASAGGEVRVVHATHGAVLASIDAVAYGKLMNHALRGDGGELVTTGVDGQVDVWNLADLGYRVFSGTRHEAGQMMPAEWIGAGPRFMVADDRGVIRTWDAVTGELVDEIEVEHDASTLAPDAEGAHVAVGAETGESMPPAIWEMASGRKLAALPAHGTDLVLNVAASADGRHAATAGYDRAVHLWDLASGAHVAGPLTMATRVSAVGFSPDGTLVAAADGDGQLVLWDWRQDRRVRQWRAHPTWIQDIVFTPDGRQLLTAGRQDHEARLWDVATGSRIRRFAGHRGNLTKASFGPDGRVLATSSRDGTARIWDVATGDVLRVLVGPSMTAAFSPDGARLLTTADDDYCVLWDVPLRTEPPAALSAWVAAHSPWRLVAGRLELPTR